MDRRVLTAYVNKNLQRLLTDDDYYIEHYEKDFEETILSESFFIDGMRYNVLVQYCTGSLDGNGWIDITYWQRDKDALYEIACGEAAFEDGATDSYMIGDTLVVVNIEFEKDGKQNGRRNR